jgi:hypothetical protein
LRRQRLRRQRLRRQGVQGLRRLRRLRRRRLLFVVGRLLYLLVSTGLQNDLSSGRRLARAWDSLAPTVATAVGSG